MPSVILRCIPPLSRRAWISTAILSATCLYLIHFNRNGNTESRRRLNSLLQFKDPATIIMKHTQPADEAGRTFIEINPFSTISTDIDMIQHNPNRAEVCIRLKPGARCPNPNFIGRLYGKSMVLLDWVQNTPPPNEQYTEHCGSYGHAFLEPGMYFLEILIIHCNGFGHTRLKQIIADPQHLGFGKWRNYDFTHECLEDVNHNRITGDYAYLSIASTYKGEGDNHKGHWKLIDESKIDPTGVPHHQLTRYQPQGCRRKDPDFFSHHCLASLKNSRIENEYTFAWTDNQWIKDLENFQAHYSIPINISELTSYIYHVELNKYKVEQKVAAEEPVVCLMGDSHSHEMWRSMFRLKLGHRFIRGKLFYPELDQAIVQMKEMYQLVKCKTFILALGQWPSSNQVLDNEKYRRPFTFEQFHAGMMSIVKSPEIQAIDPDLQIYLRTIHLNPLGDYISHCGDEKRPNDWRSPTVIDGYNLVIEDIVNDIKHYTPELRDKVHFLDTRFINEPMWDSSLDFNHLHPKVSDAEALYIAGEILPKL